MRATITVIFAVEVEDEKQAEHLLDNLGAIRDGIVYATDELSDSDYDYDPVNIHAMAEVKGIGIKHEAW